MSYDEQIANASKVQRKKLQTILIDLPKMPVLHVGQICVLGGAYFRVKSLKPDEIQLHLIKKAKQNEKTETPIDSTSN